MENLRLVTDTIFDIKITVISLVNLLINTKRQNCDEVKKKKLREERSKNFMVQNVARENTFLSRSIAFPSRVLARSSML